ncbi:hypothetical protein D9758_009043 [Tetrapyrgos nigripes]|uniref:Uncharacterized protein n=1 Tax=Tetrapyrgos nigripes TaxID=182062 RepID=A0A8H5GAG4_9AGAR|nr:hypothetical protein D9758_009043 [Tetrapyrgos nigripes]
MVQTHYPLWWLTQVSSRFEVWSSPKSRIRICKAKRTPTPTPNLSSINRVNLRSALSSAESDSAEANYSKLAIAGW